ncbi:MAG: hypothetical protein KTR31_21675 [Myxococcales bacterium]|nr:hypothetical protein [Myxococcales bacterium]
MRVGDVVITPSVTAGAEYRTNVYRDESTPVGAANVLLVPGISAVAEGEDHAFRAGGDWSLRKFFAVADGELGSQISSGQRIGNLDRFNEFSLSGSMDTFRRNVVGFRVADELALRNWTSDAEFADVPYTSQLRNSLGASLRTNPGPALEITPGVSWVFSRFTVPTKTRLDEPQGAFNLRNTFGPNLAVKWAFLPRTELVLNGTYEVNTWQNNVIASGADFVGTELALPDSHFFKLWSGMNGRFTEKVFLELLLGYGSGAYRANSVAGGSEQPSEAANNVQGLRRLLVKTQVRYDITPGSEKRNGTTVSAGYVRDFRDSFFTNYVGLNKVFVAYNGRLGAFSPSAAYEIRVEDYEGEIARNDIVNRVKADMSYWFQDYASASLGGWWQQRASIDDTVEYDDFNINLTATFKY